MLRKDPPATNGNSGSESLETEYRIPDAKSASVSFAFAAEVV